MNYFDKYNELYQKAYLAKREYLNDALCSEISAAVERLGESFISDDEYNDVILPFWSQYNESPEKFYFEYFGSRDHVVKKLHPLIPHFIWVGWDFTVDNENDPVLIEINPMPGHATYQLTTCKPMFGEMTKEVLDDYYIHRTLEKNQRQERLFE